jgi:hypothetical protein
LITIFFHYIFHVLTCIIFNIGTKFSEASSPVRIENNAVDVACSQYEAKVEEIVRYINSYNHLNNIHLFFQPDRMV